MSATPHQAVVIGVADRLTGLDGGNALRDHQVDALDNALRACLILGADASAGADVGVRSAEDEEVGELRHRDAKVRREGLRLPSGRGSSTRRWS